MYNYIDYFNLPEKFTLDILYDALKNKLIYIDNLDISDIDKIFFKNCTLDLYHKVIKQIDNFNDIDYLNEFM